MRIVVIANCASGGGGAIEERTQAILDAFAGSGVDPEIRCVNGSDLGRVAAQLALENPAALVAAGGDGTVSAVAGALVGTGIPLGVLPMGTLNHFAKDLGIPLDAREAARVIARRKVGVVDAAKVNSHVFINNSSIGLYPEAVRERERQREQNGLSKVRAMIRASLAVLRRLPLARIRLSVDGSAKYAKTPLLFVGNNAYKLEGFGMGKRESLSTGKLAVVHTRATSRLAILILALRALFGRLDGARDLVVEDAKEVRIEAEGGRVRVAVDGEVLSMGLPLVYTALPASLSVIVP